jgi:hypothetical protein
MTSQNSIFPYAILPHIERAYGDAVNGNPHRKAAAGGYNDADRLDVLVRAAEGNPAKLAPMAADLVERKVDVIVAVSPSAVRAAKSATAAIAIVANDLESDPVGSGFVASLAQAPNAGQEADSRRGPDRPIADLVPAASGREIRVDVIDCPHYARLSFPRGQRQRSANTWEEGRC